MDYVIGLGSNLNGRLRNLIEAAKLLQSKVRILKASQVYLTEPVGPPQPWFLNAAVLCRCHIDPEGMLDLCKSIERRMGRRTGPRWGPRVIDLDIIFWSGGSYKSERLQIPHPEWNKRLFVLLPLMDLGDRTVKEADLRDLSHQVVLPLDAASIWFTESIT